jgi:hypothetical protein
VLVEPRIARTLDGMDAGVAPRPHGSGRARYAQAFSHLALVEAAARLILAEGLEEVAG